MIVTRATNRAVRLHKSYLLSLSNVNGVVEGYKITAGRDTDRPAVVVLVEKKKPIEHSILKRVFLRRLHPDDAVPSMIEGAETDVVEVEEIVAFGAENCEKQKVIAPGAGIGHPDVTCGTFGSVAVDEGTGKRVVITNNHVAANSNKAKIGDPCLYPCSYCGGGDEFGYLGRFVPIEFESVPCPLARGFIWVINSMLKLLGKRSQIIVKEAAVENLVDAAMVVPYEDVKITAEIPEIGTPAAGVVEAYVGLEVQKTGWRTWHTEGKVTGINGTIRVSYGDAGNAIFTDQIVFDLPSAGGDSGSGIVTKDTPTAVARLFAGSDQVTVGNRSANVEELLGIEFV